MSLLEYRKSICSSLKKIRQERNWTQVKLAELLGLSQSRLSEIEKGKGSLTAEQLLVLLETFHLTLSDFSYAPVTEHSRYLRSALTRLGAATIISHRFTSPSQLLYDIQELIREILVEVPSRDHICHLAPLIVSHIREINFDSIGMKLYDLGVDGRLWWIVEGTLWAVRERSCWSQSKEVAEMYEEAKELLAMKSKSANYFFSYRRAYPNDVVDRDVVNQQQLEQVRRERDALATRWRIVSRVRLEDFTKALEEWEKI